MLPSLIHVKYTIVDIYVGVYSFYYLVHSDLRCVLCILYLWVTLYQFNSQMSWIFSKNECINFQFVHLTLQNPITLLYRIGFQPNPMNNKVRLGRHIERVTKMIKCCFEFQIKKKKKKSYWSTTMSFAINVPVPCMASKSSILTVS